MRSAGLSSGDWKSAILNSDFLIALVVASRLLIACQWNAGCKALDCLADLRDERFLLVAVCGLLGHGNLGIKQYAGNSTRQVTRGHCTPTTGPLPSPVRPYLPAITPSSARAILRPPIVNKALRSGRCQPRTAPHQLLGYSYSDCSSTIKPSRLSVLAVFVQVPHPASLLRK